LPTARADDNVTGAATEEHPASPLTRTRKKDAKGDFITLESPWSRYPRPAPLPPKGKVDRSHDESVANEVVPFWNLAEDEKREDRKDHERDYFLQDL
jgi:hypothetical protein